MGREEGGTRDESLDLRSTNGGSQKPDLVLEHAKDLGFWGHPPLGLSCGGDVSYERTKWEIHY